MSSDNKLESPLLTRREASAYLRISLRTFEGRIIPELGGIEVGGRLFWTKALLDEWLAARTPSFRTPKAAPAPEPAPTRPPRVTDVERAARLKSSEELLARRLQRHAKTIGMARP